MNPKTVLESSVRKSVETYAQQKGFRVIGLHLSENTGWPDIMCLGPKKVIFFIEFKKKGKTLRRLQEHRQETLQGMDFPAYGPVDSVEQGKAIVDVYAV